MTNIFAIGIALANVTVLDLSLATRKYQLIIVLKSMPWGKVLSPSPLTAIDITAKLFFTYINNFYKPRILH